MLLRVNLEDLRESTHSRHYECYRRSRLEQMGFGDSIDAGDSHSFQVRDVSHFARLYTKLVAFAGAI